MKNKGKVLAEGEATGHAHRLQHTDVFEVEKNYLTFNIVVDDEYVSHEEHKPIKLSKGKKAAGQVNEWDPLKEEIRVVVD